MITLNKNRLIEKKNELIKSIYTFQYPIVITSLIALS